MPNRVRSHFGQTESVLTSTLKPKHLTKQEFARRLYQLMLSKGWNQSELARQSGLNRDAISTYIRGKVIPTQTNRDALANALGVDPDALLPNIVEAAIEEDDPAFEMKISPGAMGVAWLRVNMLVRAATAVKIVELLEADNALEGTRGSNSVAVQHRKGKAPAP